MWCGVCFEFVANVAANHCNIKSVSQYLFKARSMSHKEPIKIGPRVRVSTPRLCNDRVLLGRLVGGPFYIFKLGIDVASGDVKTGDHLMFSVWPYPRRASPWSSPPWPCGWPNCLRSPWGWSSAGAATAQSASSPGSCCARCRALLSNKETIVFFYNSFLNWKKKNFSKIINSIEIKERKKRKKSNKMKNQRFSLNWHAF